MDLMTKVMHNISGITVGALLFIVGELCFQDPSILWLKNLFVYLGLFIIICFLSGSFKKFVESRDPNYGSETYIESRQEQSKNASNAGKAKAFDSMIFVFGLMFVAFSLLKASWEIMTILTASLVLLQAISLAATYKEFSEMWKNRG